MHLLENKASIDYRLGRVGLNRAFSLSKENSAQEYFVHWDMKQKIQQFTVQENEWGK